MNKRFKIKMSRINPVQFIVTDLTTNQEYVCKGQRINRDHKQNYWKFYVYVDKVPGAIIKTLTFAYALTYNEETRKFSPDMRKVEMFDDLAGNKGKNSDCELFNDLDFDNMF